MPACVTKVSWLIDDIDLLIAGIAITNKLVLVTHNIKHFKRVENLDVYDWAK
jgi:tRNA(fMet)-specific endonuclease VapC